MGIDKYIDAVGEAVRVQEDEPEEELVPWLDRWVEDNPWPILALIFLALFVIFCSIAWNMGPAGATSSAGTVACTGDGTTGQRFEVVYIGTTFEADRAVIERELTIADRAVQRSSIAAGRHLLLRWEHDDRCRANIQVIEQRSTGHWNEAVSVLASTDPGNNVLVFSSGESSEGACGRGDRADDDRPGVDNVHQLGGRWALVTRCGWSAGVIVHEIAHSLGAVQPSAPHVSSDRFHTSEAVDLLTSGWDGALTCGGTPDGRNLILDCGNDDYFDPTPEPGEYLSTHWNIADSVFFTPRLAVMNG